MIQSPHWDCQVSAGCSSYFSNVGAVTLASGVTGLTGTVSSSNSLIGSSTNDQVGFDGVTSLTNGNYVVVSRAWDCQVSAGCSVPNEGAVTFGSGTSGVTGAITVSNSLIVPQATVTPLTNGNYVVTSSSWDCEVSSGCSGVVVDAGSATFGSGTTGISGFVSTSNSLVGSTASDQIGYVTALANGNYVVGKPLWDCQVSLGCSGFLPDVGALTFGSGTTGVSGFVSTSNSLVGSSANDNIGGYPVTALTNGNFVASSPYWDCQLSSGCSGHIADVGAATFGSGTVGITGTITTANSLVGSTANDSVGGVGSLINGNYVVLSPGWDCQVSLGCIASVSDVGAATFGSGVTGVSGQVSVSNSLVGSTSGDRVGAFGLTSLTNGDYVIGSAEWDCQVSLGCKGFVENAGALTVGSGLNGVSGVLSAFNSFVGSSTNDRIGLGNITPLENGSFLARFFGWDCLKQLGCSVDLEDAGSTLFVRPDREDLRGAISSENALVAFRGGPHLQSGVQHFLLLSSIYGPPNNRPLGLLVPTDAEITGNIYALQGDLDNDGLNDMDDPYPLDVKRNSGIDGDGDGYESGVDINDANFMRNTAVDLDVDGYDSGTDVNDSNSMKNTGVDLDSDGFDSGTDTDDSDFKRNTGTDNDADGYESGTDVDDGDYNLNTGIDNDGDGAQSGTDWDDNDPFVQ